MFLVFLATAQKCWSIRFFFSFGRLIPDIVCIFVCKNSRSLRVIKVHVDIVHSVFGHESLCWHFLFNIVGFLVEIRRIKTGCDHCDDELVFEFRLQCCTKYNIRIW